MSTSLSPSPEQIEARLPVWMVLSEFFLDTELNDADYDRIAKALKSAGLSEPELEGILRHEVYPICHFNLAVVAGEWSGFNEDFIREKITPRFDFRPKIRFPMLKWWMIREHWRAVQRRLKSGDR